MQRDTLKRTSSRPFPSRRRLGLTARRPMCGGLGPEQTGATGAGWLGGGETFLLTLHASDENGEPAPELNGAKLRWGVVPNELNSPPT